MVVVGVGSCCMDCMSKVCERTLDWKSLQSCIHSPTDAFHQYLSHAHRAPDRVEFTEDLMEGIVPTDTVPALVKPTVQWRK